jgi:hypothetical protein
MTRPADARQAGILLYSAQPIAVAGDRMNHTRNTRLVDDHELKRGAPIPGVPAAAAPRAVSFQEIFPMARPALATSRK